MRITRGAYLAISDFNVSQIDSGRWIGRLDVEDIFCVSAQNTHLRLHALVTSSVMVAGKGGELRDALEPARAPPADPLDELPEALPRCLESDRRQSDKKTMLAPFVSSR